jgi:hypothetical protein
MNPNNGLLLRYLQAVGEHLTAASREDVLAELRANLQAQMDDRAEELNRPLTEAEIAAILKDHGRPIVVAARYSPQQYLIGPAIFPYYLMTLRKAAPFAIAIIFLANCSNVVFAHTGPELIAGILRALGQVVPDVLMLVAWVTVAFAIAEYVYARNEAKPFTNSWDPANLPAIKPKFHGKSRAARIADLVFHCLFLGYVLEVPSNPFLILGPGAFLFARFDVTLAPIWHLYYVALLVLLFFQLLIKIAALSIHASRWQQPLNVALKFCGLLLVAWLARTNVYFLTTGPATSLHNLAALNWWMYLSLRIVLAFLLLDLVLEAWRLRPSFQAKRLVV